MEKLTVIINGADYIVVGSDFWDMLEKVKDIPGRKYTQKKWELPCSLEDARTFLQPLQIVNEDELLEAEISDIQRVQARLIELAPTIELRTKKLDEEVGRYSYRSKSSVKAGLAHDSAVLAHALENASTAIDKLTEPQVKTMYAALRLLEEE